MEDGFSRVLCGLGDTKEVLYSENNIIITDPSFDDAGCPFDIIYSFSFFLTSFCVSRIIYHNVPLILLYRGHVDT